jgi:hypothetical protein
MNLDFRMLTHSSVITSVPARTYSSYYGMTFENLITLTAMPS